MTIDYRTPWIEVRAGDLKNALQRQYDLEITSQHQLWAQQGTIIGRNAANDDVMVQLANGYFAIVHLTWAARPGDAIYPSASLFSSEAEASRAMVE